MKLIKKDKDAIIRIKSQDLEEPFEVTLSTQEVELDIIGYEEEKSLDISPLMPYRWSQKAEPFISALPIDPVTKERCITGCTSIAVAMLANYYANVLNQPHGMDATAAYVSKSGTKRELKIEALPKVEMFAYDCMNFATAEDFATKADKQAAAEFLQHICYSNRVSFASSQSSCSLSRALSETINGRMHLAKKAYTISADEISMDEFKARIYDELRQGYPIIMSGSPKSGTAHTFICDGFRMSDGKFHFNMGFNSKADGWYLMDKIKTSYFDYTQNLVAIINVRNND